MNLCSKPRCTRTGSVVLAYDYANRRAVLEDPVLGEQSPHVYVLCGLCAERLTPPRGWTLEDRRARPPLFVDEAPGPRVATMREPEPERQPVVLSGRQLFFGSSA